MKKHRNALGVPIGAMIICMVHHCMCDMTRSQSSGIELQMRPSSTRNSNSGKVDVRSWSICTKKTALASTLKN